MYKLYTNECLVISSREILCHLRSSHPHVFYLVFGSECVLLESNNDKHYLCWVIVKIQKYQCQLNKSIDGAAQYLLKYRHNIHQHVGRP